MSGGRAFSTHLRIRDVQRADAAVLISLRIGKWLNRSITIQFATADLDDESARIFLARFLKLVRDWLGKRSGGPLCYVAIFEGKGGLHVHLLLHVPFGLWKRFGAIKHRWLKRALSKSKRTVRPEVLHDRAVFHYKKLVHGHASERDYLKHLRGALRYRLKGATRMDIVGYLGLTPYEVEISSERMGQSPQGSVWGRRVSVSHSLLLTDSLLPLHADLRSSWLDDAEREAEAGRGLHRATLSLGDPYRRFDSA